MDTARARQLAREHIGQGDPVGWFEPLYATAQGDPTAIQWADLQPNPGLVTWLNRTATIGARRRALVVGCGLGDDAELLASRGFATVAFDIAPTAIAWCRRRYPDSTVGYQVADLLTLPPPAPRRTPWCPAAHC